MALTFAQRLAEVKAKKNKLAQAVETTVENEVVEAPEDSLYRFGDIILNEKQAQAVEYAKAGKSFVLTGAAGTGKTATQGAVVEYLEKTGSFSTHDFKYIGVQDSIAIVAFTKVAVRNIQKALRKNPATAKYARHCMTIHSLLEYAPEQVERISDEGELYTTRMFVPHRNADNPLGITHLIIEEASMVGLDLWANLYDALQLGVQIIYLGDINQIPPVFGKSIMSYALCKLPVIELTHVYRQALDNPIIANAHRVLNGESVVPSADGRFNVITGNSKYQVGQERMGLALGNMFNQLWEVGDYDPDRDMILIPYNKQAMGTTAMNEKIASFLGAKRKAIVTPIKAGFQTLYLAVGDKVLVDKQAGWITSIQDNPKYMGQTPPPPGYYTRDGSPIIGMQGDVDWEATGGEPDEMPNYDNFKLEEIEEDITKRAASHIVTVSFDPPWAIQEAEENDEVYESLGSTELGSSGDFAEAKFQFGYAMTIHKAQGSEWPKVYILFHQDHMNFLSRELVYTAMTRAREVCTFICKMELLDRAIAKQKIAGVGLAEKIMFFNGGALADLDSIPVVMEEAA